MIDIEKYVRKRRIYLVRIYVNDSQQELKLLGKEP
jgi:hypothetical protein